MRQDAREKRAQFIDCHVKTRETFDFAHPVEQLEAVEKYCCSLYGSNLYDYNDNEFDMICSAWRTGVKLAWGVHRGCSMHLPAAARACTRGHLLEGEPPDEVPHLLPEPSGQSKP
mgnify:CR=1 FL=1